MNTSRLEQLLTYLQQEPNEPFNLYALAMEYLKQDPRKALHYLEQLLVLHESYVPTYYQAAKVYIDLNLPDKAKETFEKGLTISLQQGNRHAHRELQSAYNQFLDEIEE